MLVNGIPYGGILFLIIWRGLFYYVEVFVIPCNYILLRLFVGFCEWNGNGRLWVQFLFIRQQGKGPARNANLRPRWGFRSERPLPVEPFPRGKGCRIRSGPLLKMLPMERRKTMLRLCVVSPVPRLIFRPPSSIPAATRDQSIYCSFFLRLNHDEIWWCKLCSAAVFEAYGLFLWLLSCVYRAPSICTAANPLRCKNVGNGQSLVVAPTLCIRLLSANQYVCKTTKQRASKTLRQ